MYLKLPPFKGGMEKHIKALSQWQVQNRNDVVLCFNAGESLSKNDIRILPNIKLYKIKPQFIGIFIFHLYTFFHLLANKKKFDVIHIHGDWSSLVFAKLLKKITFAKIVVFNIHGQVTQSFSHKSLFPRFLKHVDRIFSTGYESGKILENMLNREIIIQPSGINDIFFEASFYRKKNDRFRIITVANLVPVKNLNLVLDIAKKLQNSDFLIIGDGREYDDLMNRIKSEYILNVSLLGNKDTEEIKKLYEESDCFLLTSLAEGTPTVIMEAMAVGLPIVCSNAGGMEYFLKNSENGFVIKSFKVDEYVTCLQSLMNDLILREKISKINQKVAKNFSWAYVAKRITILTQEALNAKK